ncbi:MAG: UDP-N-acetylmuramate dehydrogenase [Bacillota bacterium]|nr:UDP-N-acetylmuramate dehydrogenase [Bacillota bacterium]
MKLSGFGKAVRGRALFDEPMSKHTTWRIGGKADCLFMPVDAEDIVSAISYADERRIPYMVIGNGSNMLVLDGGIRGLVICIGDSMAHWSIEENVLAAQSGCILSKIARETAKMGYAGLEWAAGIPASLGGAAVMNAGAYGHSFYDRLQKVEIIDSQGSLGCMDVDQLDHSYRNTSLMSSGMVVTKVFVALAPGDAKKLTAQVEETLKSRRDKQPLEYPSAGSVFKNPPGDHAGRLVEAAGLRGLRHGDAQVSEKHGNFIVNLGEAKAEDVLSLIDEVRNIVKEKFDVSLEPEVRLIGEV